MTNVIGAKLVTRRALLAATALASVAFVSAAAAETAQPGTVLARPAATPPAILVNKDAAGNSVSDPRVEMSATAKVDADTLSRLPAPAAWSIEAPADSPSVERTSARPEAQGAAAPRAIETPRFEIDARAPDAPSAPPAAPSAAGRAAPSQPAAALPEGATAKGDAAYRAELAKLLEKKPTDLKAAYAAAGHAPLWIQDGAGMLRVDRAHALLASFALAESHALPRARYDAEGLKARIAALAPADVKSAAALELALTDAFLTLARDIAAGMVEPRSLGKLIDVDRPEIETAGLIQRARATSDFAALIEDLAPKTRDYAELKRLYNELRADVAAHRYGDKVPGTRSIRHKDRGERVEALRTRLIALGFMDKTTPVTLHPRSGEVMFDDAMLDAVKTFQDAKGLVVDGIVGANTLSQINMDPSDRVRQIAVNMERARWHNRELGHRRIVVNIPEYMARLYDGASVTLETRVVVGKPRHATAEFSGEMTHMVVNPTWNVPYSIATKELLPELQANPYALESRNINVLTQGGGRVDPATVAWDQLSTGFFPYRLRQSPGSGNALGDVKFMFPNKHSIYLHDTPSKSLFDRTSRAFSHGCVRVAKPVELAEALLAPNYADPTARYQELTRRYGEQYEHLAKSVPVHILYRTAWADETGDVQFRRDIYGRDALVAEALERAGVAFP